MGPYVWGSIKRPYRRTWFNRPGHLPALSLELTADLARLVLGALDAHVEVAGLVARIPVLGECCVARHDPGVLAVLDERDDGPFEERGPAPQVRMEIGGGRRAANGTNIDEVGT